MYDMSKVPHPEQNSHKMPCYFSSTFVLGLSPESEPTTGKTERDDVNHNKYGFLNARQCWSRQCNSTRFTSFLEKYHPSPLMQPEELENEGFTLKTYQMFSVHTAQEEFIDATIRRLF